MTVTLPGPFRTISDVKAANRSLGHHWFDRDTVRFFRSKIHGKMIAGRFFVSSSQFVGSDGDQFPRAFKVQVASDTGAVDTVSFDGSDEFPSAAAARSAIRAFLEAVTA